MYVGVHCSVGYVGVHCSVGVSNVESCAILLDGLWPWQGHTQ